MGKYDLLAELGLAATIPALVWLATKGYLGREQPRGLEGPVLTGKAESDDIRRLEEKVLEPLPSVSKIFMNQEKSYSIGGNDYVLKYLFPDVYSQNIFTGENVKLGRLIVNGPKITKEIEVWGAEFCQIDDGLYLFILDSTPSSWNQERAGERGFVKFAFIKDLSPRQKK